LWAGTTQSVQQPTMSWAVQRSNPGAGKIFCTHAASYTMGTRSFPGVMKSWHGVNHPPPSTAKVKERVALYIYSPSGPSWPVLGWTLLYPFFWYICTCFVQDCNNTCYMSTKFHVIQTLDWENVNHWNKYYFENHRLHALYQIHMTFWRKAFLSCPNDIVMITKILSLLVLFWRLVEMVRIKLSSLLSFSGHCLKTMVLLSQLGF
jgi:hypothetical protein